MNDAELKALIATPEEFITAFRKGTLAEALNGKFVTPKIPRRHELNVDGSLVVVKFIDTVKYLLDAKMRRIHGRDSLLSYIEMCVVPEGAKPTVKVFDVKQIVIGVPRETFEAKHTTNLVKLVEFAKSYGINLTASDAWVRVYDESYKKIKAAG